MLIVVTYDVNTEDSYGRRRLRRVARVCQDFGQRVQLSVFECVVSKKELLILKARLLDEMDDKKDSIRIYFLDDDARSKIVHMGIKAPIDFSGPLIV